MNKNKAILAGLGGAAFGLVSLALAQLRENRALAAEARSETRWADHYHRENVALRAKVERLDDRWQATLEAVIADWGDECDDLITEIGELKERINAQAYVIGALKTQVRDSQQAGMVLQQERFQLCQIANAFSHGMTEEWEATAVCQAALKDWQGFVDRERLAAYANAGKVVEGLDSNIPD
jgi:hypothetical protein